MKTFAGPQRFVSAAVGALLATTSGLAAPAARAADAPLTAESYMVVDCLLPGQVRKLGRATTFLTPRRPVRTSAVSCEIRGGEYVAADRADFNSSLAVWMPSAQGGDPKAQAYVGRIFAEGMGRAPDFAQAAVWYQKAADQGFAQAMIDLGQLYELGRGVPQDQARAVNLYRKAGGLPPIDLANASSGDAVKLNAKYEAARADADSLARELAEARKALADERAALASARTDLQRVSTTPTPDSAALTAVQRRLQETAAQLEASNARSAQLAADLAKSRTSADQRADPLAAQLRDAQAERARMVEQRAQMERDLAAVRGQLADRQGRLAAMEAEASQAKAVADQANARLTATLATLQTREKDLGAAKLRLADEQTRARQSQDQAATARLQAAQANYDQLARELDRVRADASARRTEIAAADAARLAREAELQQARTAIAAAETRLAQARTQLDDRDARLKASEAKLTDAQARIAQVQRDYDAASQKSAALSAQVAQLQREVAEARQAGAGASKDVATREAALAAREAKIKALEVKLTSALGSYRNAPAANAEPGLNRVLRMSASSKFGFNQSYAILIGESNYRDPKLPKLATPGNDVGQLGALLQSRYGFNVNVMLDKSRAEILRELDILSQKLTENDTLLIYYAGHGGMEKVRNGEDRGYWLPIDAEIGSSASQISNQEITYQVARMAARKVLIVADSCYSGLLTQTVGRAQRAVEVEDKSNDYLIGMAHKQSRNVLTSGRLEPVLDGGGQGNHSVFAAALIDVLKSNSDVITSEEIYSRLVRQVMGTATSLLLQDQDRPDPQQPTYSALDNGGHVYGDFLFVPKSPT